MFDAYDAKRRLRFTCLKRPVRRRKTCMVMGVGRWGRSFQHPAQVQRTPFAALAPTTCAGRGSAWIHPITIKGVSNHADRPLFAFLAVRTVSRCHSRPKKETAAFARPGFPPPPPALQAVTYATSPSSCRKTLAAGDLGCGAPARGADQSGDHRRGGWV